MFGLRGFSLIISFALSFIIVRELGTKDSGVYFYISSFIPFATSIVSLGLGRNLLKDISLKHGNIIYAKRLLSQVLLILILSFSIFALIFLFLNSNNLLPTLITSRKFQINILLIIIFFSINHILSFAFQGTNELFLNIIYSNVGVQFFLLCLIMANVLTNVEDYIMYLFISNLIFSILGLIVFFKNFSLMYLRPVKKSLQVIKNSVPLYISNFITQFFSFAIIFIIEQFYTPADVSYYSVCLRISIAISIINFSFSRVYSQEFGRLVAKKQWHELKQCYKKTLINGIMILIPVVIIGIFFSKKILSLYNEDFIGQYKLLILLIFVQPFSFFTVMGSFILQMLSKEVYLRNIIIIIYSVCILLGLLLIYFFSIYGAAISLLINQIILSILFTHKTFKLISYQKVQIE